MDINQINRVVFVYIIKMTQGDEEIDLYNITEDQYGDEIMNNLFNHWGERGYPDIITEYFGNQFIFEPTMPALVFMLGFITDQTVEASASDTSYNLFHSVNVNQTCCNILCHYAYWYIRSMGYENFLLKLKEYVVNDDIDDDN